MFRPEEEIKDKIDSLLPVIMNEKTKRETREKSLNWVHALCWVLKEEDDVILKRLKEVGLYNREETIDETVNIP